MLMNIGKNEHATARRLTLAALGLCLFLAAANLVALGFTVNRDIASASLSPGGLPAGRAHFVRELVPVIEQENQRIALQRARLAYLLEREDAGGKLDDSQLEWIQDLGRKYKIDFGLGEHADFRELLFKRVDTVPVSLALAQAINESAWGTSRFAREGNNLFGQWCFEPGCGIVPAQRGEGLTHEVKKFDSLAESVRSYLYNLNTNQAYQDFRKQRAVARAQNKPLEGLVLARGLKTYSARGNAYVQSLVKIMTDFGFAALDSVPATPAIAQESKKPSNRNG